MLELHLPLDFERLPEFRLLCEALGRHAAPGVQLPPKHLEQAATFLWSRLWVELGYLAQRTNAPGKMTKWGAEQLRQSVGPLFGEGCDPLAVLCDGPEECRVLKALPDGEYHCDLFARFNPHLSGDYKTGAQKGNVNSAIARQQKQLKQEAVQQGILLPPEIFKRRDGTPMTDTEQNRSMILIRNLDNALGSPQRQKAAYTAGMMADAHAVIARLDHEQLMPFYYWVANNKGKPTVPSTAEQMLVRFEELYPLA